MPALDRVARNSSKLSLNPLNYWYFSRWKFR